MTDPTAYGHFQQETGESRQVKGRPEGDCRPLKTDFVDTVWIWLMIRNDEFVVVS